MSRRTFPVVVAAVFLGALSSFVRADVLITATDVTVSGNGTGYMDFTISSNNGDTLSGFGLTLLITPVSPPNGGGDLTFTGSQPNAWDAQPDPTNASIQGSDYVFSNVSLAQSSGSPYWGLPGQASYSGDTISSDADSYYDPTTANPSGAGYVTLSSTGVYLATVEFQAGAVLSTEAFQISLVPASYNASSNRSPQTFFADQSGNNMSFTSSGGLVTVTPYFAEPAMTTPEPASSITGLMGALFLATYSWLRHRGPRRKPARKR